ncbi:hypothetical protein [Polluticaenibacter yanchengensis]|uniref:Uncharacterized protein n=1 Tax=Polluticaenibacter yanchengensis TaxID=3014562 RepID=A0ABT4UJG7_9BACT|nr:hypothetical protein [Chitinophagaceae bacterium LY-5]
MTEQSDKFILDKNIWTQDDFEIMGWHDANVYGLTIERSEDNWTADFLLDIDYIFKWVHPIPPAQAFTFWVAPCTLIFRDCFDLHIDFRTYGGCLDLLEIADLYLKSKTEQEKNMFVYEWTIELQQGQITLKSYGLEQIVRQQPKHVNGQVLTLNERDGINFGRKPC